jgi:hypothetical protein
MTLALSLAFVASIIPAGYLIQTDGSAYAHMAGGFVFLLLIFSFYIFKLHFTKRRQVLVVLLYLMVIGLSMLVVFNNLNTKIIVGRANVTLSNQTVNKTFSYEEGEYAIGSVDNITIPISVTNPCGLYQNYTLAEIIINTPNFSLVNTYPTLPVSGLLCNNNLVLKIKMPDYPYKGTLSITEKFQ